jgi:hypothetical protein
VSSIFFALLAIGKVIWTNRGIPHMHTRKIAITIPKDLVAVIDEISRLKEYPFIVSVQLFSAVPTNMSHVISD